MGLLTEYKIILDEFDLELVRVFGRTTADEMRVYMRDKYRNLRTQSEEKQELDSVRHMGLAFEEDSQSHLEK